MADPSIQTFCCHKPRMGNPSVSLMSEFNSTTYNIVCLVSSILGCLGAIYQMLPRTDKSLSRRWFSLTSQRGRQIVVWLALADFLASLGVSMRSIVKLNNPMTTIWDEKEIIFCTILAAWIEYFYMVTWVWTLLYAVDTWLAFCQRHGYPKLYHTVAWIIPALLTTVGLTLLYFPNADCHNYGTSLRDTTFIRLLPNYVLMYTVIAAVMVLAPCFYIASARNADSLVSSCLGQVTNKERSVVQAIRIRFALTVGMFAICWTPNLVNGIIIWCTWGNLSVSVLLGLWYFMAVINPLQAFFNSIVYRRANTKIDFQFNVRLTDETTPLLPANINT
uniref:Putative g-protein coupled receptor n=1 Tax=Triatoma infestans TaxID=30076 RepID=A0A023F147_TRIIF